MAIFSNVSDIQRTSGYTKPFEKTTGIRKVGLAMLGYNDDGTKNLWGNLNPMSYVAPGLQHAYAKGLATGDTDKVLGENTDSAIGAQLGSLKLASNFIPGLGIVGKMGISAGLSAAQGINNSSSEQATNGIKAAAGTALVQSVMQNAQKDKAITDLDKLVAGTNGSPVDESTYTTAADSLATDTAKLGGDAGKDIVDSGITDVVKETDYTDGLGSDTGVVGEVSKGAGLAKGLGTVASVLNIAGDAAGVIQGQLDYNKGLKNSKKKILKNSILSPGSQNYL